MHRRNFLARCGLALAGGLVGSAFLPGSLDAATQPLTQTAESPTASGDMLMGHLSSYSALVHSWGARAFTKETGLEADDGTVHLLVRVDDLRLMKHFFKSKAFDKLGAVYVIDNTLSFTFQGEAYTVTNELPDDFTRIVTHGK